jgi:hypothetical protein
VTGIRIQCHIGDHAQIRKSGFQCLDCARHKAIRIPGLCRIQTFARLIDYRKQSDCRNPQCNTFTGSFQQHIDTLSLHTRHGSDLFSPVIAFKHEYRINQVITGQHMFAHQAS